MVIAVVPTAAPAVVSTQRAAYAVVSPQPAAVLSPAAAQINADAIGMALCTQAVSLRRAVGAGKTHRVASAIPPVTASQLIKAVSSVTQPAQQEVHPVRLVHPAPVLLPA